jgi:hypothetical protein
MEKM